MTVRTTTLGGTDWNNEQLTDDDLNDTVKRTGEALWRKSTITDNTEGYTTSATFEEIKGAALVPDYSENRLLFLTGSIECKGSSSNNTNVSIYIYNDGKTGSVNCLNYNFSDSSYSWREVNKWLGDNLASLNSGSYVVALGGRNTGGADPYIRGVGLNLYYFDGNALTGNTMTVREW